MKGRILRAIRDELGWSQSETAERLGIHPNTLARQERGEMQIGEPTARLACLIFIEQKKSAAQARAAADELGRRRAGSIDRGLRAAEKAARAAIKRLEKLLGSGSMSWLTSIEDSIFGTGRPR